MRFEIEKVIDNETKEFWTFNMFELNAVFVSWRVEKKPKGKRVWKIEKFWDKYRCRDGYRMVIEPELPEIIRNEALSIAISYLKVKTWNEWKGL
jgi:hypothetical protein